MKERAPTILKQRLSTPATANLVFINGRFVPESEAGISIYDSALMFGDMAFEFTRTFRQVPFRLREHLERLYASLKVLRIDCGMSIEEMEASTHETLQLNLPSLPKDMDVQIMHDVSRGVLGVYQRAVPMQNDEPTVVISVYPLDLHQGGIARLYDTGVKAVIPPQRSIPSRLLDPKMKTRSRQHYMIADLQVREVDPKAWAVLTDEDGFLTEGTGANVFLVKNGSLLTPEPRDILRGISRGYVMELAARLGIPCHERNLEPYDLHTADEAFFTSTRFSLVSISHLDRLPVGKAAPGPVAKQLLAAWSKEVGVDTAAQAKMYARLNQRPA